MNNNDILRVAVVGGDGTGPEVTTEAVKVFKAVAALEGIRYELKDFDLGGERYLRTGEILPEDAVKELATFKAILLGAVGHPDVPPGVIEKGLLLAMRFRFDQYINLRPVKLFPGVETPLAGKGPGDIDFVVVRENTEDMYVGAGGFLKKGTPDEVATQTAIYTRKGCERCIRWAFEFTRKRNKKKQLTLVAKTNVLTYGHDLWWRTFQEVAKEYPDIRTDYNHVDACCMWMVKNPEFYDVIKEYEHVRRHHHRFGSRSAGRLGRRRRRQHQSRSWRAEHVRADGRRVPQSTPARMSSIPSPLSPPSRNVVGAVWCTRLSPVPASRVMAAVQAVTGTKMKSQAAGKMGFGTKEIGDLGLRGRSEAVN